MAVRKSAREFIRVWVYKKIEVPQYPDAKPSATNKMVTKVDRGDFEYYEINDNNVKKTTRAEADKWAGKGNKVETHRGYPAFMIDMGFRA